MPNYNLKITRKIVIRDEEFFTAYYAVAKPCCNGRIHFAFADRHGFRHNKWSTDFPRINGSIDDLLHMC